VNRGVGDGVNLHPRQHQHRRGIAELHRVERD
jgi:hypothetical protein